MKCVIPDNCLLSLATFSLDSNWNNSNDTAAERNTRKTSKKMAIRYCLSIYN